MLSFQCFDTVGGATRCACVGTWNCWTPMVATLFPENSGTLDKQNLADKCGGWWEIEEFRGCKLASCEAGLHWICSSQLHVDAAVGVWMTEDQGVGAPDSQLLSLTQPVFAHISSWEVRNDSLSQMWKFSNLYINLILSISMPSNSV